MSSITDRNHSEQTSFKSLSYFLKQHHISTALRNSGAYKQRGIPVITLMPYLVALIYTGKSMFEDMRSSNPFASGFGKDAVYRFLNSASTNWQSFLLSIAYSVVNEIKNLTSEERRSAFVIDDTMYGVPFSKKTELVSKVFDHTEKSGNKFKWGFRLLTLCWTDGVTLLPLAFRHLASSKESNQRCGMNPGLDKRSRAYRIRQEAVTKAPDVVILLLKAALLAGVYAKYVLFDTWFAYPVTIAKIRDLHLHVTARVKDTTKITYLVDGEKKTAKAIYKENRKRRGKSRYLLSKLVTLDQKDHPIAAKLVYVRNRNKRNHWIAILCTDTSLTEEEVIALYGKRWDIEVFFKVCKSYLKLTKEYQQLSYDALTAHTTIVMLRYMILAVEKRKQQDIRRLGELFFRNFEEMVDIRFEQALVWILDTLVETLKNESFGLTDKQVEQIMDTFLSLLPPYISRSCAGIVLHCLD